MRVGEVFAAATKEGVTVATNVPTLAIGERIQTTSYAGGLGNTVQNIVAKASPLQKDLIHATQYDQHGRQLQQCLPYISATNDSQYRDAAVTEQGQFYQSGTKIALDTKPYSLTEVEPSPLGRVTAQTGIGNDWHANGKKVTIAWELNRASDNVRKWVINSGLPSSAAAYGDYQLYVNTTTDENGNRVKVYTDKLKRVILKKVEADASNWLSTYNVYDDRGRLAFTITPKGTQAANYTPNQAFLDQWAFQYKYDDLGRLIEYKAPAAGWTYTVYDALSRVVMTQNADQRTRSEWAFVKYDVYGRPVVSGFKVIASSTRSSVQTSVTAQATLFESVTNNAVGYTLTSTYPSAVEGDLLSISYFDNYAFLAYTGWDAEAHAFSFTAELGSTIYETALTGLATGAKIRIVGSNTWLNAVQYYDKLRRPLQTISENHLNGMDRHTSRYNTQKQLVEVRLSHHNAAIVLIGKFTYDHFGRRTHVYENVNGAPSDQLVAQYEYNELGQVVDKKLHNTGGSSFLQSVDYRYSIRGWLTSINNAQRNVNSANNDETNDYFGMELLYNTADAGIGNTALYNGNVSAIKWKGVESVAGATDQKSYKYVYDKAERLLNATSQLYSGTAWNKESGALNEAMTYDHNGNIATLQRNHRKHQLVGTTVSFVSETVDNLSYSYGASQGNQLVKVEDAVATGIGVNDFKNTVNVATEYTYNGDGNIVSDQNKGISTVSYNVFGKPSQVIFGDGRKVDYVYTAAGQKLTTKTWQGTTLLNTTDYVGSFVYTNGVLSFFAAPEGRIVKNGSVFEHEYALGDHQGNTRVVFSSVTPAPVAPNASFEGDANDAASQYANVANVVPFGSANHTPGGSMVVRMNQTYKIGPSKSVKVFPGDRVDMEMWEYHEGSSGFGTSSTPLAALITSVAGAFGGVSGGVGESGLIYSGVNSAVTAFGTGGNQGDSRPAAYLNYILFDKNYKVLDAGWQLAPATTFTKQKLSFPTKEIKEAGYIYMWLSYDDASNNYVYFDDLKITHTKSNIVQSNDYYPFGMPTASSWTRDNSSNSFLYNSGSELNATTGWYETYFRGYDATLGRFLQIDPLAHVSNTQTPYNYAYNSPVALNDPLGDRPQEVMLDLEMYGGGGGDYQYYDYSDDWTSSQTGRSTPSYRIIGTSNDPFTQFRSIHGNATVMSQRQFDAYYGLRDSNGNYNTERRDQLAHASAYGGDRALNFFANSIGATQGGGYFMMEGGFHHDQDGNPITVDGDISFDAEFFYIDNAAGPLASSPMAFPYAQGKASQATRRTKEDKYDGHAVGLNITAVLGGGFNVSVGYVKNKEGEGSFFFSVAPSLGLDAGVSGYASDITSVVPGTKFNISDYGGYGSSHNITILGSYSIGGNSENGNDEDYGYTYMEESGGFGIGSPVGYSWQRSYTWLLGQ